MSRNALKIYHHPYLSNMTFLFCVLLLLSNYAIAAEDSRDRLHQFLKNDMAFSEKEFKSFREGKTVAKTLKTDTKHEIGIFGIARIDVPREFFLRNYREKGMNLETASANSWGIIKTPPQIDDLKEITLPKGDIKDLKSCKPGDCKVKAPIGAIQKISQLDANTPDFEEKANQLLQQDTVDYVSRYLKDGNRMLVEYSDKKNPVRLTEQFQGLLKASPYLQRYVPDLYAYLEKFPNGQLAQAEDVFIWLKEDFGEKKMRSILSVNHAVFYRPQGSNGNPIVALKQLYATHYFEASLGLTVLFEDPEGGDNSLYLLNITRARIDVLRQVPGFLAGDLYKGARNMLHKRLSAVKSNMEKRKGKGTTNN
jgi:hypothetical protein